jgi:hypothetical protein
VKLVWSQQTIDGIVYSAGQSSGLEFDYIGVKVSNDFPAAFVRKGKVGELKTKV